jgi:hypothetical protein
MRHTLKIGITVVVVAAIAMSGIALAQTSGDSTTATTVAVQDTPAYSHILETLAPLVADETIDQTQAAAVAELLARDLPRGPRAFRFQAFAQVADLFDMTPLELKEALADYDSLAAFAAANGSSADEVIGVLVDAVSARLDEAVANGRITADEAATRLEDATQHITDMVNGDLPAPMGDGAGFGGPGGHRGPGGPGGPGF